MAPRPGEFWWCTALQVQREKLEQVQLVKATRERITVTLHLISMIGCVGRYGKVRRLRRACVWWVSRWCPCRHDGADMTPVGYQELRVERELLRERTAAVLIIQRAAKPWVAERRAKREAWALEVIAPVFRRYVQRRKNAKNRQVCASLVTRMAPAWISSRQRKPVWGRRPPIAFASNTRRRL